MLTPKDIGLSDSDKVFFVAEAGINHNGSLETGKRLIGSAKSVETLLNFKREQLIEF